MAFQSGGKMSHLSLTGALNLYQKGLFKAQYKEYWFWFDELTCCLKYYKDKEAYLNKVHKPLGFIELQFAKVTPGLTTTKGGQASNAFHIKVEDQLYVLATEDNESALKWIEKLQEKRSEFIKSGLACNPKSKQEVEKYRTLPAINRPGVLTTDCKLNYQGGENLTVGRQAKSFILQSGARAGRYTERKCDASVKQTHRHAPKRSVSVANFHTISAIQSQTKSRSLETLTSLNDSHDDMPTDHVDTPTDRVDTPTYCVAHLDTPTVHVDDVDTHTLSLSQANDTRLQVESSEYDKLKACLLESEREMANLRKEIAHLNQELENKDQEILEMSKEMDILREELIIRKVPQTSLQMENESLKNIIDQYKRSVKSLDDEIELHKLSRGALDEQIQNERQKAVKLDKRLRSVKGKYVTLLGNQFKVITNTGGAHHSSDVDGELLNESKHNKELLALLKEEGRDFPLFKTYCSSFEDHHGDLYDWEGDNITQKYLCRLLHTHYNREEQEKLIEDWDAFLSQLKELQGEKGIYQLSGCDRGKLRDLLRRGLPFELRTYVWSSLVHQVVGKMKEAKDKASGENMTYYQSLLRKINGVDPRLVSDVKKDLLRTLPMNRHFQTGGTGIERLERVLLAYSLHNDKVGYCQSMNMIAATGLLFLDEETAFWFLVMVIEKLMPAGYYSSGLLGAIADLGVMKKLVADKLPRLNAHLQEYLVDVTLVTFSWFLTVFTDALPTESVLRVLDCYLFEGHKILFRVSLAILKINEHHIIKISEQTSVLVFLKEAIRHMFDVEEILDVAFNQLKPFPRRSQLASWHQSSLVNVKKEWCKKEKKRQELRQKKEQQLQNLNLLASIALSTTDETTPTTRHLPWDCGCVREKEVWLYCNEKGCGRLGIASLDDGSKSSQLDITSCQVNSRARVLYYEPKSDVLLLGALDFYLQAIDCKERQIIWTHKFSDSLLDIVGSESGSVVVALANGTISMIKCEDMPCLAEDVSNLYIDSSSVSSLVITKRDSVWCGAGKTVTVVNMDSFEQVHSLTVAGTVNKMQLGPQGVWMSFRSSTKLCLYDTTLYMRLLEVDYTSLTPAPLINSDNESRPISKFRITSLHIGRDRLYIGNGKGEVLQLHVTSSVADPVATIKAIANKRGIPARPRFRKTSTGIASPGDITEGGLLVQSMLGQDGSNLEESVRFTRHFTQVGRTVRPGRPKSYFAVDHDSVYKLEFLSQASLGSAVNEPITFILPMSEKLLVGVNRLVELDKSLAILSYKNTSRTTSDGQTNSTTATQATVHTFPVVEYLMTSSTCDSKQ